MSTRQRLCLLFAELTVLAFAFTQMVSAANWYVATNGTGGGTSWADATNSLQGAINKAVATDTVLVSNGVYDTGGMTNYPPNTITTNRVVIYKAITVRSANNDPTNTIIKGAWDPVTTNGPAAVRCVYMTNGVSLIGFMLTNGATGTNGTSSSDDRYGGGVICASPATSTQIISNCVIAGNSADYGGGGACRGYLYNCTLSGNKVFFSSGGNGGYGGGSYNSYFYNCTVVNNWARSLGGGIYAAGNIYNCTIVSNLAGIISAGIGSGGGAYYGSFYNCLIVYNSAGSYAGGAYNATLFSCCTIVSNSAAEAGGVYNASSQKGVLTNCIVYFNTAPSNANWSHTNIVFVNSCTTTATVNWAQVTPWVATITNDPAVVNKDAGNWRLNANSPCVNTGTNQSWMTNSYDLDGRTRIRYRTVDMGAFETIYEGTLFYVP